MSEKNKIPVMENAWVEKDGETRLIATQCEGCKEVFFPKREADFCSHCYGENLQDIELSCEGVIRSYTRVDYKPAGGFYTGEVPFNYVIVTFPEGVNIPGQLIGAEMSDIKIGSKVRTVVDVLDERGDDIIMSYKFALVK